MQPNGQFTENGGAPFQGQPAPGPMPGPQPPMGQPMPGQPMMQGQPMGQPMMQGQPMMGQPMPGAPMYAQPMPVPKPPKQPMDPAKKKKIIILCSALGGVAVVGIALAIILPIVLAVDYGPAYKKAKEARTEINAIYNDYGCENVEYYVNSSYTSDKTYEGYITDCRDTGSNADKVVSELGSTAGVSRNSEIKAQFDVFKAAYDASVVPQEAKDAALDMYAVWHKWVVASSDLSDWDETDADISAAANILINSGNATFKTYGEGWAEHRKAAAEAYRTYWATSYSASNKSELRTLMDNAENEYKDYVSQNKPSTDSFPSVTAKDTSRMKTEFSKLYDLITETYEQNYNEESDDCMTFLGQVICD